MSEPRIRVLCIDDEARILFPEIHDPADLAGLLGQLIRADAPGDLALVQGRREKRIDSGWKPRFSSATLSLAAASSGPANAVAVANANRLLPMHRRARSCRHFSSVPR